MHTLLFLCMVAFTVGAYRSLFYLGDVAIPEGSVVYSVQGLLTGALALYHDYTIPPYSVAPYTPLFYLSSAAVAWASGDSISAIYISSRLLSTLCTFGAAFFVGRITLLIKPDVPRALAMCLPFSILTLVPWGFAARPDMMAVMLSLGGIYTYLRTPNSLNCLGLSALILALSWWCKQSFMAAPAAVFLALLCARDWRRASAFLFFYLSAIAVLAGATEYLSHGWFFANVISANVTTLDVWQVVWLTKYGYMYLAPFVSCAALFTCIVYGKDITREPKIRLVALYLLASFSLNLAACMKDGAYYNYLLEPLFAASILASLAILWASRRTYGAVTAPLLLLASLAFSTYYCWYSDGALDNALGTDIAKQNAGIQSVIDKINALPGDVLVSRSALAVRAAKPVLATDLFNVRYLEEAGKLSTFALAERIKHKELAAIVSPVGCMPSSPLCSFWPAILRKAILENYAPDETLAGQVFWYAKRP